MAATLAARMGAASLIVVGAGALIAVCTTELVRQEADEPARVESVVVAPESLTLSAIEPNAHREFTLAIHNNSPKAVRILAVQTTCGCTTPQDKTNETIEPRGVMQLKVAAKIPQYGSKAARIRIQTDCSESPEIYAEVQLVGAEMPVPRFEHEDDRIELGGVDSYRDVVSQYTVATFEREASAPWIVAAESDADWLRVSAPAVRSVSTLPGGVVRRHYQVEIAWALPNREADVARIDFKSSDGERIGSMRVTCRLVPAVTAIPRSLFWSATESAAPASQMVVFRAIEFDGKLKVSAAEEFPDWLRVEPVDDGGLSKVKFEIDRTALPDSETTELVTSEVQLETNHPDCPTVTIPVVVRR